MITNRQVCGGIALVRSSNTHDQFMSTCTLWKVRFNAIYSKIGTLIKKLSRYFDWLTLCSCFVFLVVLSEAVSYRFDDSVKVKCAVLFLLQCIEGENTWRDLMKTALENLIVVLKDENTISPYEMCSSGLVQALFTVLNNVSGMDDVYRDLWPKVVLYTVNMVPSGLQISFFHTFSQLCLGNQFLQCSSTSSLVQLQLN